MGRSALIASRLLDELGILDRMTDPSCRCKRKAVACSILAPVSMDRLSFGRNAQVREWECTGERGACGCSHAEIDALFRLPSAATNCILCVNFSPCLSCANAILLSGKIGTVAYGKLAEHWTSADELLRRTLRVYSEADLLRAMDGGDL